MKDLLSYDDIVNYTKQAERIRQLEKENSSLKEENAELNRIIGELRYKIKDKIEKENVHKIVVKMDTKRGY